MSKLYDCNSQIEKELKLEYPNLAPVVCAAFGISHAFYKDKSYEMKIAESHYSKVENKVSFLGVFLTLKRFDK